MRKKIQILSILLVASLFLLASCKTQGHCPAYSKATTKVETKNV